MVNPTMRLPQRASENIRVLKRTAIDVNAERLPLIRLLKTNHQLPRILSSRSEKQMIPSQTIMRTHLGAKEGGRE
jgi:hypothetical protein